MSLKKQNTDLGDKYVKVRNRKKQDVTYANVDLEIESKENLQPLIDEFGEKVIILYHDRIENGNDFASLECYIDKIDVNIPREPVEMISAFCLMIENLSVASRKIWDNCLERKFDIGFESGNTEKTYSTKIQTEYLSRLAKIGGRVVITIYPILNYTIKLKEDL